MNSSCDGFHSEWKGRDLGGLLCPSYMTVQSFFDGRRDRCNFSAHAPPQAPSHHCGRLEHGAARACRLDFFRADQHFNRAGPLVMMSLARQVGSCFFRSRVCRTAHAVLSSEVCCFSCRNKSCQLLTPLLASPDHPRLDSDSWRDVARNRSFVGPWFHLKSVRSAVFQWARRRRALNCLLRMPSGLPALKRSRTGKHVVCGARTGFHWTLRGALG